MRQHILEEYNNFLRQVVRDDVSPRQKHDLRIAFMCGAVAVFSRISNLSSSDLVMPNDVGMVRAIQQELLAFAKQMREGTV